MRGDPRHLGCRHLTRARREDETDSIGSQLSGQLCIIDVRLDLEIDSSSQFEGRRVFFTGLRPGKIDPIKQKTRGSERALDRTKSSPTDLVSEADLLAEKAIRDVLAARAPDDAIMGEEGDDRPGTTGLRWIVDPLDGTINFLFGFPVWCVSVACEGLAGLFWLL